MQKAYKYGSVTVTTKSGKEYVNSYCDYYMQDGILTVFRTEAFERYGTTYYVFEEHFLLDNVERIMCIEK